MAMAANDIDRNADVAELEIKSSPDVSMEGSQGEQSQALDPGDVDTPVLTMETSTEAFSTASLHDDIKDESDNDLKEPVVIDENSLPNIIEEICPVDGPCIKCKTEQPCSFRFTYNGEALYICNEPCIKAYQAEYPEKYTVMRKNYTIEEITPKTLLCSECKQKKTCYFCHNFDGENSYYCSISCLDLMMADEKDKYAFKLSSVTICIDQIRPKEGQCLICEKVKPCEFSFVRYGEPCFLCERTCIKILSVREHGRYFIKSIKVSEPAVSNAIVKNLDEGYKIQAKAVAMIQREQSFRRRCSQCTLILMTDENVLTWEVMDFCDEICLGRFQNRIGSRCAKCNTLVQHTSLGKYCVRFGSDIRQFCNSSCLDQFKKGLQICYYCQGDISASTQEYLAPVGDKGQYKHFCSQSCVQKFDQFSKNPVPEPVWAKCAVCSLEKATTVEMEVTETASQRICSNPCFAAYKFVSNITPDQCKWCKKYFERKPTKSFTTYDDANPNCFCSLSCMTIHIYHTRFIVSCSWCKSLKYNFNMIRKVNNEQAVLMCSLHCLSLYQESANARSSSNGVSPPTLAPPVPSGEQGRADVMTLAAEQLITLTESRKRRQITPSPKQEENQRNESAKKNRSAIPNSPRSGRNKKTRRSSPASVKVQGRPGCLVLPVVHQPPLCSEAMEEEWLDDVPSPAQPVVVGGHRPRNLNEDDIFDALLNYGSEDEVDSDEDLDQPREYVPRRLRLFHEVQADSPVVAAAARIAVEPAAAKAVVEGERMRVFDNEFRWERMEVAQMVSPLLRRKAFVFPHGPTTEPITNPYEIFVRIWDSEIMEEIALQTNLYAQQYASHLLAQAHLLPNSRIQEWKDTNADELYCYFALVITMGILIKTKLEHYWTAEKNIFWTPGFSTIMPFRRFQLLSRCLHFSNNTDSLAQLTRSEAKIHKIKPIVDHLNLKFQGLYNLGQNIALDESLTQWKGWLDIKQYIPDKAAKVGIKTYEVCDSKSGYLWRFEVHSGNDESRPEDTISGSIPNLVLRLLQGLNNRGHTVWMDNYYNSPALARILSLRGFDCVGTLRTNRQFVPEQIMNLKKSDMAEGQICGYTSGDVDVMVWRDQNKVAMISTYHGMGKTEGKPSLIRDYNVCMGGVDKKDQMISMFPMERKRTQVWYKKFFKRLLNVSILNAYIINKSFAQATQHRAFRMQLVVDILQRHHKSRPRVSNLSGNVMPKLSAEARAHFPKILPFLPGSNSNRQRRTCVVCKVKRTIHTCPACNVSLCFDFEPRPNCFLKYHT